MGFFSDYETDDGTPYWGQQPPPRDPEPPSPPSPIALDTTVPIAPRAPLHAAKDPNTGAGWRRDATGKPYYYDPAAPEASREVAAADVKKTYMPGYDAKRDSFAKRNALNDQILQQQAAQRPRAGQAAPANPLQQRAQMRGQSPIRIGAPGYAQRPGQTPPPQGAYNPQVQQSPAGYAPATAPDSAASAAFGSVYAQRTNRSLQRMGLNNATKANAIRR